MSETNRPQRVRRGNGWRLLARFLAYQIASWSVLARRDAGPRMGGPGRRRTHRAVHDDSVAPLRAVARMAVLSGRRFRLLVVRAVLYTQLLLPLRGRRRPARASLIGVPVRACAARSAGSRAACSSIAARRFSRGLLRFAPAGRPRGRRERAAASRRSSTALRIAQLSDLHVGPQTSRRFLAARRARRRSRSRRTSSPSPATSSTIAPKTSRVRARRSARSRRRSACT